jgi:MFS transporter, DHA1 family, inner membrane transport protein
MSTDTMRPKERLPFALWALATGFFGVGTGEFVMVGLLLNVAGDLKVSTSAAGLLVTDYALGVVAGALLVAPSVRRLPRKTALLVLMGLFVVGNLLCAVSLSYPMLMAARVITGLAHAAFFGSSAIIATELVSSGKKASAIAVIFTGVTLANVIGVPLGTLIGQIFGWRLTYWTVTLLDLLAFISIVLLIPRAPQESVLSVQQELRVVRRPQVLLAFAMTIFGQTSVVTVLTYIAPILVKITGINESSVSPILLLFGIGFVVGNTIGGKLADRSLMMSFLGILSFLAVVLAGFTFTSHNPVLTLVTVFLFGAAAFGIVPCLQLRVVDKAKGAPNLASAFNIASFNLGTASGAYLGSLVLSSPLGLNAIPWVGGLVATGGITVAAYSWSLDNRDRSRAQTAVQQKC